jgi:hypothetical protein
VEDSQHVGYEEDQQYGAQADASTSTITPAAMAVVPSTASENQHQDNNQYQHIVFPFLMNVKPENLGSQVEIVGDLVRLLLHCVLRLKDFGKTPFESPQQEWKA